MTDEYKPGNLLLGSKPFVHVLSSKQRGTICDECFNKQDDLLRCSACKLARYCGRHCQKSAWRIHKHECLCLRRVSPDIPTDSVRLLYRLLIKLQKYNGHDDTEEVFGQTRSFKDLVSHSDMIREDTERMTQFMDLTQTLAVYSQDTIHMPSGHDLLDIFGKMVINSFSICDGEMRPIGVGLYLGASILDHSCRPNAVIIFSGTTANVRCVKPVDKEIPSNARISYIDLLQTTSRRSHQLQTQYYFTCRCEGCLDKNKDCLKLSTNCPEKSCPGPVQEYNGMLSCTACDTKSCNSDTYREDRTLSLERAALAVEALNKLATQSGRPTDVIEQCERDLGTLTLLHTSNVYVLQIHERLFDAYIDGSLWAKALEHGRLVLHGYRHHLEAFHPVLGVHLMKMGKILLYLGDVSEAKQYLIQAEEILSVTHGKEHKLYQDLTELLMQSSLELTNQLTNQLTNHLSPS